MVHRVQDIDRNIPITILFGSRSWMETTSGYTIKYLRHGSYVDVQIIKGAGHHVYADKPSEFNAVVNGVCEKVEKQLDKPYVYLNDEDTFKTDAISDDDRPHI